MAGPHSSNPAVGTDGPPPHGQAGPPEGQPLEYPDDTETTFAPPQPPPPAPAEHGRKRLIIGTLLAIALIGALTAAIVYGVRTNGARAGGTFTEASSKTAIQGYLDALDNRDIDTVVRNALCGMYDGVHDKRADQALARQSSDALRRQFSKVEVTSIDKIVYLSQYQAQVLFSMQVTPATGGQSHGPVQGVAQLLFQRGQILVCSYILRTTAGSY
ncbi:MAG: hypothetical protein JO236_11655 [Mycobacterium sp.]|uniref:Rv0361 family membrane protein n=1 Tax=Mycobacterium sp. TaxID=1785 RepID=UPI001ECFE1F0|nr:hypothetical protein [Mycobacterium sp.]MBW0018183.1 hypothetical protein [Mycobacterium sp.]